MKTISTLKKLIIFYFYSLIILYILFAVVTFFRYINNHPNPLSIINDYDISSLNPQQFSLFLIINLGLFYLYIKAIYLIKNCLNDLSNDNYFSKTVTNNLKKAGNLLIISGVCSSVYTFLLRYVLVGNIKLVVDHSLMGPLITGIFLMFLSEVFIKARKTEEENNLTI